MKRNKDAIHLLPSTPPAWFAEIKLAIADARQTKPFGQLEVTDANLFHLAPLVALKFRGQKIRGQEAKRVTETALANYVVNSDPDGIDHGLASRPILAFALCYMGAHLAIELLDETQAEAILVYCEKRLDELEVRS